MPFSKGRALLLVESSYVENCVWPLRTCTSYPLQVRQQSESDKLCGRPMGYGLTSISPVERVDEVDKASPKFCFVKSSFRSPMDTLRIRGDPPPSAPSGQSRESAKSGKSQKRSHLFAGIVVSVQ